MYVMNIQNLTCQMIVQQISLVIFTNYMVNLTILFCLNTCDVNSYWITPFVFHNDQKTNLTFVGRNWILQQKLITLCNANQQMTLPSLNDVTVINPSVLKGPLWTSQCHMEGFKITWWCLYTKISKAISTYLHLHQNINLSRMILFLFYII